MRALGRIVKSRENDSGQARPSPGRGSVWSGLGARCTGSPPSAIGAAAASAVPRRRGQPLLSQALSQDLRQGLGKSASSSVTRAENKGLRSRLRTRAASRSEEPQHIAVLLYRRASAASVAQSSRRPKAFASSMQPMVGRGGSSASGIISEVPPEAPKEAPSSRPKHGTGL